MNEVHVTVVGMLCSDVKYAKSEEGVASARFQLRSMPRRFDAKRSAWADSEPSYYSATCWRQLADHVAASVHSGDPVIVHGRLKIDRWKKGDDKMVSATIDVQAIGHDLRWGTSAYRRGGGPVFVPAVAGDHGVEQATATPTRGDGGERTADAFVTPDGVRRIHLRAPDEEPVVVG